MYSFIINQRILNMTLIFSNILLKYLEINDEDYKLLSL